MEQPPRPRYRVSPERAALTVEGYNWAPPFSNFLPGIAGPWGKPMWVFYVSRGQAVISAGVRDKNGQMLEFQSFNQALARVELEGFRTFLRLDGGPVHEPFRKRASSAHVRQELTVAPAELVLRERNQRLGIEIEVVTFTVPGQPWAMLLRQVTVRNLRRSARHLEWLDGAARVLPFGLDQQRIKGIPRHIEAMMGVARV
ncbi:MAG: hypothetical protein JXR83_04970, partial [Deltaproteobacteria bacterium]|nr:hypothetical protein [Deltaproteobacteria bacterium]